jgi:hypothetical protein
MTETADTPPEADAAGDALDTPAAETVPPDTPPPPPLGPWLGPGSVPPEDLTEVAPGVTAHDVAVRFSPVWYQDAGQGGPDGYGPRQDFVTVSDYDGDLKHDNNWDNLGSHDLYAYLYYALVATETHYFLTVSQYHPRDWEMFCTGLFTECHEGDMETVRIVVKRDQSGYGSVVLVHSGAHGMDWYWTGVPGATDEGSAAGPPVDFEDDAGNFSEVNDESCSHVRVYVQEGGHGPIPCRAAIEGGGGIAFITGIHCAGNAPYDSGFLGGDGFVFRYTDGTPAIFDPAQAASSEPVSYGLVPYEATLFLWKADLGDGHMFKSDGAFYYDGERGFPFSCAGPIGSQFDPEQFLNDLSSGNPAWSADWKGSHNGDPFFDPAIAFAMLFDYDHPFSTDYSFNPYVTMQGVPWP